MQESNCNLEFGICKLELEFGIWNTGNWNIQMLELNIGCI
jgi:hypothetical protein